MDILISILKWIAITVGAVGLIGGAAVIIFCLLLYADWSKNGFH